MSTTYETRTQTRTDRFGGYSSYSNPLVEEEEEYRQTSTFFDDEETPEFEVQKNYNYSKYDDVTTEEQEVTMAMPNVIRQNREKVQSIESESKVKLRARAKIAITVYSIILLSLIAFAIYNAVAINQMQAIVAAKNQTYITETIVINDLLEEYNSLGSSDRILSEVEGEFIEPTESNIIRVSKSAMEERSETEIESNWFEELCSFLSGLFN